MIAGSRPPVVVGILGGMGPMATVEAFRRITLATPAQTDQDHLHVIVDSDASIPDRTEAVTSDGPSPLPGLLASAHRLVSAGAGVICMPCNTAHVFFDLLQGELPVPVVHMVDETASVVATMGDCSLGLLATAGTVASEVYQSAFRRRGLHLAAPDAASQRRVSEAIACIKAGQMSNGLQVLLPVVADLERSGARTLVLGCTEISLVGSQLTFAGTIFDALQIMVDSTVDYALGRRSLPSIYRPPSEARPGSNCVPRTLAADVP